MRRGFAFAWLALLLFTLVGSTQWVSAPVACFSKAAWRFASRSSMAARIDAWSISASNLFCAAAWCPSFRFFAECASESVPGDEAVEEAAALCMNFMVRSLEETPFGVSGAMLMLVCEVGAK